MKKKHMTTYWMDVLTYIILPFIIVVASVKIIRALISATYSLNFILLLAVEMIFIGLYSITFFNSHYRTKLGFICFRVLIIATAIRAAIDFILSNVRNNGDLLTIVGYLLACGLLWVYPNEIYFRKRKDLFKNKGKSIALIAKKDKSA